MKGRYQIFAAMFAFVVTQDVYAATVIYGDRTLFMEQLSSSITDGYDAPGYSSGDIANINHDSYFSDAAMSAVLGETRYFDTGWGSNNLVADQNLDPYYCTGCNGSFLLDFTATSVGSGEGVYGVGLDVVENANEINGNLLVHAYVTYGDDTQQNILLPASPAFWGITSDKLVRSIHIGESGGGGTTSLIFKMDDLTIGAAAAVPVPATMWLMVSGLIGLAGVVRKR